MIHLTPLQSKLAALAVLALATLAVVGAIALPLWWLNHRYDVALEDSVSRLQRYSRIIGMRDGLQKKALEVKALEQNRHFLKSASPALAAAELQEQAKSILDQSGGKISSIQILPHKDDGQYRQVSVMLQLTAPRIALKPMLYAIESARPYLFINNLAIKNPFYSSNRTDPAEPDLTIQFELTGFSLKVTP
jgi:general secretion pathway protein M